MLNEMRLGRISDSTVTAFKQLSRPLHFGDGLEVTELWVLLSGSTVVFANVPPVSPPEMKLTIPTKEDCRRSLGRSTDMRRWIQGTYRFGTSSWRI